MSYTFTQWWSPNKTAGRGGHSINKIVLHHAATTNFDGIGATFQNTSLQTSAHYGVGPGKVCQYVDINDTAWHAGVWSVNQESIGVEHVNSSGAPDWNISDETIQTGGELLANIAKQLGWNHLAIGENVFFHSDFKATYCPGKIRDSGLGQKEVDIANQLLSSGNVEQPSVAPSNPVVSTPSNDNTTGGGWLYFDYRGNVREQPTTASGIYATYNAGTWVRFDGYVHGQTTNGSDKWLRSSLHKKYVHESVTGGTFGLPDLGYSSYAGSAGNNATGGLVPQNGTFKAYYNMKIRTAPTTQENNAIDTFSAGATHSYDNYIDNDGYRWISFIGDTTKRRVYVARRKLDNSEVFGICY